MTQWTITKDLLAEPGSATGCNSNAVGLVGPRRATMTPPRSSHTLLPNSSDFAMMMVRSTMKVALSVTTSLLHWTTSANQTQDALVSISTSKVNGLGCKG